MQTNTVFTQLHETAVKNIDIVLLGLGLKPNDVMLKKNGERDILWLKTYPQVLERLGLENFGDSSDPYDYDLGNGEIYDEEGRMFTMVAIAIESKYSRNLYFWIEFIFMNDQTVKIEIGATEIDANYCDALLGDILPDVKQGHVCTIEDALIMLHTLKRNVEKNPEHYNQFL